MINICIVCVTEIVLREIKKNKSKKKIKEIRNFVFSSINRCGHHF